MRVEVDELGAEFFAGTMPRLLIEGVVPIAARAAAVRPIALSDDVLLLPSGGVSFIAVLNELGFAEPGVNLGIALLSLDEESKGVRFGVSFHRFRGLDGWVWLAELGFVQPR